MTDGWMYRHDGQIDLWTDRQTDKWVDRQTGGPIYGWTDRRADR